MKRRDRKGPMKRVLAAAGLDQQRAHEQWLARYLPQLSVPGMYWSWRLGVPMVTSVDPPVFLKN